MLGKRRKPAIDWVLGDIRGIAILLFTGLVAFVLALLFWTELAGIMPRLARVAVQASDLGRPRKRPLRLC
jgi:hypothetical protein